MNRTRTLLVVTAAERDAANAAAIAAAGPYAAGTFDVPYVSGMSTKATHYAACWLITDKQLDAFKKAMAAKMVAKTVEVMEQAGRAELQAKKLEPSTIESRREP
jgi:hypothetical protein